MWYKIARENIGGGAIKSAPFLPVNDGRDPLATQEAYEKQITGYEKTNSELMHLLEEMDNTIDDYYEMSRDQQKELWDLLVYRTHHTGGSEARSDSGGVIGDQLIGNSHRIKSPYHLPPWMVPMEVALRTTHLNEDYVMPINMQTYEKGQGEMLIRGIDQYNSGKPVEREDLPSNMRWV